MPSTAFTPLQVGDLTLSSRIVLAPLTRLRNHKDHTPSDLSAGYYTQRGSCPGTLLIAEGAGVNVAGCGWPLAPGMYTPEHVRA